MSPAASKRGAPVTYDDKARKFKINFGSRLKEFRSKKGLSGADVAKRLNDRGVDVGASALRQWERPTGEGSVPPMPTMQILAEILEVPVETLALGLTHNPVIKAPDPKTLGYVLVPEVVFGKSHEDVEEVHKWGLPYDWLRSELNIMHTEQLVMYNVPIDTGAQEYGDRVIVDRGSYRPSPPGNFLYWDGMGPAIARIEVVPGQGTKKIMARVTAAGQTYEVDADKLKIIGRIRGTWRKA